MITLITTFLSKFKIYFFLGFVLVSLYFYTLNAKLEVELEKTNSKLTQTNSKLDEANKNNQLIIQAYEKTLAIEKEIAEQKAVTTEQKEVVVTKYKTLIKEVEKRGEIKQDEKSNFTIVTF